MEQPKYVEAFSADQDLELGDKESKFETCQNSFSFSKILFLILP